MKIILLTLCLVVMFSVGSTSSAVWGRRNNLDTLIYSDTLRRSSLQAYDVMWSFPKSGQYNNKIITAILVNDNMPYNWGAAPSLRSGGPTYNFANINFRPSMGKGIDSKIEIYAK